MTQLKTQILEDGASVPLKKFYPELLAIHDLVTPEIADLHILKAVRDIADETAPIQRLITLELQKGVVTYPIEVAGEYIIRIGAHPECCEDCTTGKGFVALGHRPRHQAEIRPMQFGPRDHLHFDPATQTVSRADCYRSCAHTYCFAAITKPLLDACEVPRVYFDSYYEAVISLALAGLLKMAHVPWNNHGAAGTEYRLGGARVRSIRADNKMKNATGPIRMKLKRMV